MELARAHEYVSSSLDHSGFIPNEPIHAHIAKGCGASGQLIAAHVLRRGVMEPSADTVNATLLFIGHTNEYDSSRESATTPAGPLHSQAAREPDLR